MPEESYQNINVYIFFFSVELDFKLQENKLQPLMKRLCPALDPPYPSLPYTHEVYTSTPKRKSKAEAKKHARWRLWFLWIENFTSLNSNIHVS